MFEIEDRHPIIVSQMRRRSPPGHRWAIAPLARVSCRGAPINRIGTTQATVVSIEECSGCGLAGWGWADNGYDSVGPLLYFTDGPQTIRIQGREDGISLDQVVLSPDTYLSTAPGAPKNDTITLSKTPNQ